VSITKVTKLGIWSHKIFLSKTICNVKEQLPQFNPIQKLTQNFWCTYNDAFVFVIIQDVMCLFIYIIYKI
jgi:hypothetical protein